MKSTDALAPTPAQPSEADALGVRWHVGLPMTALADDERLVRQGFLSVKLGAAYSRFDSAAFAITALDDGSGRVHIGLDQDHLHEWAIGPHGHSRHCLLSIEVVAPVDDPHDEAEVFATLRSLSALPELDQSALDRAVSLQDGEDTLCVISTDHTYISPDIDSLEDMIYSGHVALTGADECEVRACGTQVATSDGRVLLAARNPAGRPAWSPTSDGERCVFGDTDAVVLLDEHGVADILDLETFFATMRVI
ncbi:hypothetical protein [Brevibacterium sp. SMBL_HHYL_HB1]|uniref:hypothetical protein n=1 Tax=Brevibacterium sp. SMBL_HHYL_HB1 TaxID=2777556 RepID=UPI001BA758B1|nr:hypothetical protein [Brevibacterium sp. SMBL_HHYL_HB1]QUL80632.1 hypothetical protein IG171_07705 [Brevibacterium sp. SMBL_HHYL_HB1]